MFRIYLDNYIDIFIYNYDRRIDLLFLNLKPIATLHLNGDGLGGSLLHRIIFCAQIDREKSWSMNRV